MHADSAADGGAGAGHALGMYIRITGHIRIVCHIRIARHIAYHIRNHIRNHIWDDFTASNFTLLDSNDAVRRHMRI